MINFFTRLFDSLNTSQYNQAIFIIFLVLFAVAVLLRILVCAGYQTRLSLLRLKTKPVAAKADLDKIRGGLLRAVVANYVKIAEKNVSGVHLDAIVEKHLTKLSILGWSYNGVAGFVQSMEIGLPIVGIGLAVIFSDAYRFVYGLTAILIFLLTRLFAAVFDIALVRGKLKNEIIEYVEREVGQFYAGDSGSVLLALKSEMTSAVAKQTEALREALASMKTGLSDALGKNLQDLSKGMENTVNKLADYGDVLKKPLQDWAGAISQAAALQMKSVDAASKAADAARLMTEAFGKQSEQTSAIEKTGRASLESLDELKNMSGALAEQLKYVERNQTALDAALQHYETGLEKLTGQIGDSFGGMLDFHMQNAYKAMNDELRANIGKIQAGNSELIARLQELFGQLGEQSRSQAAAVVNLNEQMNMRFDEMAGKTL
ncbi:MAG: hypothetical protein FWF44_04600 [Defluviitaleaceae bacterium]|nr:hypothetical protein [Defluviitaleaceae bacterium]